MNILYEDNHLFVLDKPAGLLTQPSGTDEDSLESRAKHFLKKREQKKGNVFLEAVHRLDRPVSGIVVFAKTSKALSRLNAAQRNKLFRKIYRAEVEGRMDHDAGTMDHFLRHDKFKALIDPEGKRAILHYKVLDRNDRTTTVEVHLESGRYHQIRAQFSEIGHPIVGDQKYGSLMSRDGISLCHAEVSFPHPITKKSIVIHSDCVL